MGFWWCCCEDPCPIPEVDLRVDGWYLEIPPIPGTRIDMPSIDLTFTPDYFGAGDHAWISDCLPRADRPIDGWSVIATYFRFAVAKATVGRALATDDAAAGACLYWVMVGYTASPCIASNCAPAFGTVAHGSVSSTGGNAFGADFCAGAAPDWNFVSKTLSPFSETWNTGVSYIKIYVP